MMYYNATTNMIPPDNSYDTIPLIADIGSHTTKIGYGGNDFPDSIVRSDVAVLLEDDSGAGAGAVAGSANSAVSGGTSAKTDTKRMRIRALHHDWTSSIPTVEKGTWERANPVQMSNGLPQLQRELNTRVSLNSNANSNSNSKPGKGTHTLDEDLVVRLLRQASSNTSSSLATNPLLYILKSYCPPSVRYQLTELLFESLEIPALYLGRDAPLACYAVGRTGGIVVDMGYSGVTCSPVVEGWVEGGGVLRNTRLGGLVLDEEFGKLCELDEDETTSSTGVQKKQGVWDRLTRQSYWAEGRARNSRLGPSADTGETTSSDTDELSYTLPDGTVIYVSDDAQTFTRNVCFTNNDEWRQTREALHVSFPNTSLSKFESTLDANTKRKRDGDDPVPECYIDTKSSIPTMITQSAFQCSREQQPSLLGNIVLGGGNACCHSVSPPPQANQQQQPLSPSDILPDLLQTHIESIIHVHTPGWTVKIATPNLRERSVVSWLGGSIVSGLGTFRELCMTRQEYEDVGANIVHRKCP